MIIRETDHFKSNGKWSYTSYLDAFNIPEDDGTKPIKYDPYNFFVHTGQIHVNTETGKAEIFCVFYKTMEIVNEAPPEESFTFYETKCIGQIGYKILTQEEICELVNSGKLIRVHREGYEKQERDGIAKEYFK